MPPAAGNPFLAYQHWFLVEGRKSAKKRAARVISHRTADPYVVKNTWTTAQLRDKSFVTAVCEVLQQLCRVPAMCSIPNTLVLLLVDSSFVGFLSYDICILRKKPGYVTTMFPDDF